MSFIGFKEKLFAPLSQRDKDRKQSASFFRQDIFLVGAAIRGRNGLHDTVRDKIAQTGGKDVLCQSQTLLEFAKPA